MKIYIIAGEASGDLYGASLMSALKKSVKHVEFFGVGGQKMEGQGLHSFFPMAEISIMGFWEVVPHIPNTLNRINQTVAEIEKIKPDIVVTIDSPGFCCRVAKKLQGKGIKLLHYVAPTVWAYKPKRAAKFAKLFDHLLVILPFEPPYFDEVGLDNTYIGHPIVETQIPTETDFRKKHKIKESDKLLCVMPGSRITEITRLMPIFIETIKNLQSKVDDLKVVIPTVPSLKNHVQQMLEDADIDAFLLENSEEKYAAYVTSDAALAKSGTGTMELALANCPMVVAYKISKISHWLIKNMVKVKFANLINIILDKEIIPEFIQGDCTAEKLSRKLEEILTKPKKRDAQITEIKSVFKQLGRGQKTTPSEKAAKVVLKLL